MKYHVANGVQLQVVPTEKFKNTKIMINLTFPTDHRNFAKLALLAELLENSAAEYQSEMLVSRKLSEMYGASYGVSVLRYGNQHTLQIKMTYPNDDYLPNTDRNLTAEIFTFLQNMIEKPFLDNDQFNLNSFKIQQTNMINYLESIADNKAFYATLQLQKLYYPNDPNHGSFLMGSVDALKQITSKELYQYYRQVLRTAEITILVGGKVDPENILDQVHQFKTFSDRSITPYELTVVPAAIKQPLTRSQSIEGAQSILSLGYQLPIYFGNSDYFAAMIFNQLFGGSSLSLLFTNVRERDSLAYDIHSNYNSLFGMVTVQAGIDFQNEAKVLTMISDQLNKIIVGDYKDTLLTGIKQSLINHHRSEGDHLAALMDKQYLQQIMQISISDQDWEAQVEAVSRDEIQRVAKRLKLRATFSLNSREATDEDN